MSVLKWITVALCVLQGGYMLVDGMRALMTGQYITPGSGEHAGQLGPWARLVERVGLPAESTPMKLIFVALGAAWLAAGVGVAAEAAWSFAAGLALAVATLWYLVPGTVIAVLVAVLLLVRAGR
ncbi:hypothetical protein [Amycolatopsis xylanica]|uniref:hypothetical protein n=1 Tax=Amycolatopsis xylanica TaxID=589385 RepID=UPI000B80A3AE|nr:hypothetical protein [Amycolatopsis xylanica]